MAQRKFALLAVLAASGALGCSASVAQVYAPPLQQPYPESRNYPGDAYRGTYARPRPNFDVLEDDDAQPQGSVALSPPGPVMSPDDPRYGRPMGPPPAAYSDRPSGPAPLYSDRGPPPAYMDRGQPAGSAVQDAMRPPQGVGAQDMALQGPAASSSAMGSPDRRATMAALPPEDQPETDAPKELPPHLRRQEVYYETKEPAGTIIVDTPNTHLYLVLGGNRAIRYGVRVGRDGFTWSGVQKVTRKAEWPDWHPPAEMIERQPYLPRFMAGGEGNPMGARAMYLGSTVYRIHGTNQPSTIGQFVSSGCVGMLNDDVSDLYERVKVGARVVVLPGGKPPAPVASVQPTNLAPGGPQGQREAGYSAASASPAQAPLYRSDATSVQPLPATTIR